MGRPTGRLMLVLGYSCGESRTIKTVLREPTQKQKKTACHYSSCKRSFVRFSTRACLPLPLFSVSVFRIFLCMYVSLFPTPSLLPPCPSPSPSSSPYTPLSLSLLISLSLSLSLSYFSHSRRVLLLKQWGALAMLAIGVGLVQVSTSSSQDKGDKKGESGDRQEPLVGLVAVLMACCTSGFAGVYFEKVTIARGSACASFLLLSGGGMRRFFVRGMGCAGVGRIDKLVWPLSPPPPFHRSPLVPTLKDV